MREIKDVRIFFALWPDEEVRRKIVELLPRFDLDPRQSRFLKSSNIHMTLHFIGNSSFEDLKCFRQCATGVEAKSFVIDIDRQGYFKKPKLLWLGCSQAPKTLFQLQKQLGQQLLPCGFMPERRPFSPHVSIAHKLQAAPKWIEFEPIRWVVTRFVLVQSNAISGGVHYQVIDEYPLN
jgi:2'-5' RNA ligase